MTNKGCKVRLAGRRMNGLRATPTSDDFESSATACRMVMLRLLQRISKVEQVLAQQPSTAL